MSKPSELSEVGEAFIAGLTKPSVVGSVGTVLFALIEIVALGVFVDEQAISTLPADGLMYNDRAWTPFCTVSALRFKHADHDHRALVVAGSSFMIESLDDPFSVGAELDELDAPVDYAFLATDAQLLQEISMVLDQLPPDHPAIAVIGLGPLQMMYGPSKFKEMIAYQRIALPSEALDVEIEQAGLEMPLRTGSYLIDHSKFYVFHAAMSYRRLLKKPKLNTHYSTTAEEYPPWTEKRWDQLEPVLAGRVQPENFDYSFEVLDRLIQRMRSRGDTRVVVMELPLHPRMQRIIGPENLADFQQRMEQAADDPIVEFWQLSEEAQIGAEDFHDHGHMGNPDARRRLQNALVRHLAKLIQQLDKES